MSRKPCCAAHRTGVTRRKLQTPGNAEEHIEQVSQREGRIRSGTTKNTSAGSDKGAGYKRVKRHHHLITASYRLVVAEALRLCH